MSFLQLRCMATVCLVLIAGCHRPPGQETSQSEDADERAVLALPAVEPGQIHGQPLRNSVASDAARFERLNPDQTGVDFANRIDTSHPLKRLYYSGFACGGAAIGDIDGDGRPDLYLVSGPAENRLYRQVDNFKFEDITERAGVGGGTAWGAGAAMADVDNDGDLDIYVCNHDGPNSLYINDGKGRFTEEAQERGLDVRDASLMPTFCDYDKDGDLDVFLLTNRFYREGGRPKQPPTAFKDGVPYILPEYAKYYGIVKTGPDTYKVDTVGRADRLLRNHGDGTFTDVTAESGIAGAGHGLAATWWDYDDDGWPDLYVGNDFDDPDHLWHNNGNGTFTDVIRQAVPHTSWFSMGADAADINNDGRLDYLTVDMSATTHYKQKTTMGAMGAKVKFLQTAEPRQYMRNAMLLNTGTARFMEIANLAGLADSDWSWSVKIVDLDNDGWVDVHLTNGIPRDFGNSDMPLSLEARIGRTEWDHFENTAPRKEQNLAFRNTGRLRFEDVSRSWGLDHVGVSYAAAHGDLDGDGDLDLVVVNLDEPVSIYRNNSSEHHRVTLRLVGTSSNRFGVGARVRIETAAGIQIRELTPVRGFLSSNQPLIHFGLGEQTTIDRLSIRWPSGHVQTFFDLAADQRYTIAEPAGKPVPATAPPAQRTLFAQSGTLAPLRHLDTSFDDFQRQPLLPNKLSQLGPGMAWGDVNGDGHEDLYLAQGAGFPGVLVVNQGDGNFRAEYAPFEPDKACEDMGAVFFDADGDGDLDLYVVSGSVERAADHVSYADRLYINDGKGGFAKAAEGALPKDRASGSCVVAADYDRDGDLDLFVGGRVIPAKYPLTPRSRLLGNDAGKFSDVTAKVAPGLEKTGLVTSALWTDVDNDGWIDLLVTHEWGPVKLWRNRKGRLVDATTEARLAERTGWWNGIAGRDLDNDGDIDYVVTNFGLNTKYHASDEKPALLYYGDFDGKGNYRLIEAEYEDKTLFPIRGKSCSTHAIPSLANRFGTYHDFAKASLLEIYTPKCLGESIRLAATELRSGTLINDGKGRFEFRPLPHLAQAAPGFGVVLEDFDGDGMVDACIAQNFFSPQHETGRMDGGLSLLLKGQGDGTFRCVWPDRSGLVVPGDAKSLAVTDINADGWPDFVVGVNNDEVMTFLNRHPTENRVFNVRLKGKPGNPTGVGARVTLRAVDGTTQTAEVHAGSGYLSQSTATLVFGLGNTGQPKSLQVRWPNGEVTSHEITDSSRPAVVEQP